MTDLASLRLERIVERLLSPWQNAGGPGVTIGVVRDDVLHVHRSAGLANIELGVPSGRARPSASPQSASNLPALRSSCSLRTDA